LIVLLARRKVVGEVAQRRAISRAQCDGRAIGVDRLVAATELSERDAAIVERLDMAGMKGKNLLEADQRLVIAIETRQQHALQRQHLHGLTTLLYSAVEEIERLQQPVLTHAYDAKELQC